MLLNFEKLTVFCWPNRHFLALVTKFGQFFKCAQQTNRIAHLRVFWEIDVFALKRTDFDKIYHFWEMMCHDQTSNTTAKFCIPLQSPFMCTKYQIKEDVMVLIFSGKIHNFSQLTTINWRFCNLQVWSKFSLLYLVLKSLALIR